MKAGLRIELQDEGFREQYSTQVLIKRLSAQIEALRRQRGLSQKQLAQKAGTTQPRISRLETPPAEGAARPNWEVATLNRIALALGTRLKISFETYGSLVDELETKPESLLLPSVEEDSMLAIPQSGKMPERLRLELQDSEYREQYATSTMIQNVSSQIQVLRRQRGFSQVELARKAGTEQPGISTLETPNISDKVPNWEIDKLNRIAWALGTRLRISLETFGSLLEDLDRISSESLRRADFGDDPVLFPLPDMPAPDPSAPERTRWMQELMIPWLWQDDVLDTGRLIGWLRGRGLPPVGHDEQPFQWLLRGIRIPGPKREFLEKRLAERLAVVLGEQPDVHPPVPHRTEEFLINLYWTCAGLERRSFLAEPLWQAYQRLRYTGPGGAVRDALQGALIHNQYGEVKPLKEIWKPMVEKGRHWLLRGDEIIGFEGILVRHMTVKPDMDEILRALTTISNRWDESRESEFSRLMWRIPDLDRFDVARKLWASANDGWSTWARGLLPTLSETRYKDGSLEVSVRCSGVEVYALWPAGQPARTGVREGRRKGPAHAQPSQLSGEPKALLLLNEILTRLGDDAETSPVERKIAHEMVFNHLVKVRSTSKLSPVTTKRHVTGPSIGDEQHTRENIVAVAVMVSRLAEPAIS